MVFPIAGGTQDTGYEISNSVRVGFGHELSRTFTEVTAERKKHTMSCWAKRGNLGDENHLIYAVTGSDSTYIRFDGNDTLRFRFFASGADQAQLRTNRLFRDPSAWYHVVLVYDSAQGTASNRVKIYINGVQETSFSTEDYPDQNEEAIIGHNAAHKILGQSSAGDFYVADWYFIGNQALAPTDFGETNDNGVWVPKKYTGSFGSTNDTFLQFKQTGTSTDASGIGADTSGEGNHMAVTNLTSVDVTTDTPTNNFATLIPALNMQLSEGNTKAVTTRTGNWDGVHSSIGVTKGKWYFETKVSTSGTFRVKSGVVGNPETFTILFNGLGGSGDPLSTLSNTYPAYGKGVWLSHWYDQNYNDSSTASAQSSGDILQFALDMDNYKMWIGVNGQFKDNSNNNVSYSDVASGSSATVTIASAAYTGKTFFPDVWLRDDAGSDDNIAEINFGNPSFAISSGNSDGNGYGNFEYAVPSGYYALCTKNLAEYG
jgi:hypothetical protein